MIESIKRQRGRLVLLSTLGAIGLYGCAGLPVFGNAGEEISSTQQVQNCGVVTIGSPSKYVCNDKVYTSFELAKLRTGDK